MGETVAPEFVRFVAAERHAGGLAAPPRPMATGDLQDLALTSPNVAVRSLRIRP